MQLTLFASFALLFALIWAAPTSPKLHVSLSTSRSALTVVATVSNDGLDAVSILRAGILYNHPSNIIQVVTPNGTALPFEGVRPVLDLTSPAGKGLWISVPPGKTFTNSINLDTSFDFPAPGEYTISAASYLQVKTVSQEGETLVPYKVTKKIRVTEEALNGKSKTFARKARLEKRSSANLSKRAPAYIDPNCDGWKHDQLHQALWDAYGLSYVAAAHVPWLEPTFWSFFKTSNNANYVQGRFNAIGSTAGTSTCTNPSSCVIQVSCVDTFNVCASGAIAASTGDIIYPCNSFWNYPAVGTCANQAWGKAEIMLHELSHSHQIGDIVYGLDGSRNLSPTDCLNNADTYRYYARSTDSGCNW